MVVPSLHLRSSSNINKAIVLVFLSFTALLSQSSMAFQRAGYLARRAISRSAGSRYFAPPSGAVSSSFLTRLFLADKIKEEVDPGVVEGTELRIVKYPHPSLRAHNEEVTAEELKDGSIAKLAKEMFLVM